MDEAELVEDIIDEESSPEDDVNQTNIFENVDDDEADASFGGSARSTEAEGSEEIQNESVSEGEGSAVGEQISEASIEEEHSEEGFKVYEHEIDDDDFPDFGVEELGI